MQLIKLNITDRAGAPIKGGPVELGFDVEDIVGPIRFNSNLNKSYFTARMLKDSDGGSRNIGKVDYMTTENLAAIFGKSLKFLHLTVNSRRGIDKGGEMHVFVTSRISENLSVDVSGGTKFFYLEDGDPLPVEYIVDEDITTIVAQQATASMIFDAEPTPGSLNPVYSGGIWTWVTNNFQPIGTGTTDLDPAIAQQNNPPGAPATGDRYLVGTVPTGAWVGYENNVAEWDGLAWVFTAPTTDDIIFLSSTAQTFRFNGTAWVAWAGTPVLHNGNSLSTSLVIGTNNPQALIFKTNNSESARITSAGSWGFGTVTPSAKVSIKGTTSDNTTRALDVLNSLNATMAVFRNDSRVAIGNAFAAPTATLHARGIDATSSNYVFKADSLSQELFAIRNDGIFETGTMGGLYSIKIGNSVGSYGSGSANNSIGYASLQDLTSGSGNNMHGNLAGLNITSGGYNNGFGDGVLQYITTQTQNTAFGHAALATWEGNYNAAFGPGAGQSGTGDLNLIGGYAALAAAGSKSLNVSLGPYSGNLNVGSSNIFLGPFAATRQTAVSNMLFVDNQDRTTAGNELTKSLIVGTFNADPALQTLYVNGSLIHRVENAVFASGSLNASQIVWYIDEATDTLTAKVKYSDGATVKTVAQILL